MTALTAFPLRHSGLIEAIEDAFDNTRILRVRLEDASAWAPVAGQYALLSIGGLPARAFSIASAPHQPAIEFHIKNTGTGTASALLAALQPGERLSLSDPLGDGYWRDNGRPILALAGGTGIAPLKAIIDTHFNRPAPGPARLYWGGRTREHLYLDAAFRALEKTIPGFRYVPVLSDPGQTEDAPYRHGFIGDALTQDFPSLDGYSIYIAGPEMMVQALMPQLLSMGADRDFIFGDGLAAVIPPVTSVAEAS